VVGGDAYLIDFEGEPARALEQRRAKSSGLRDVAGLLRSFDYAAAAAQGRAASAAATERRTALLERFRAEASNTFLACYRAVLENAETRWVTPDAETALLDLFLIEKAAYEIRYEAANRPTWLGIPLRGLAEIADRVLGTGDENA
jgi:maltose alpha-D-glucosyltransferase / alpha-amylase